MNHFSLWNLVVNASFTVQLVMLTLVLASLISWAYIIQQARFINKCKTAINEFEFTFWSGIDLGKLYAKLSADQQRLSALEGVFVSGFKEFMRLHTQNSDKPAVVMEGMQRAMSVSLNRELNNLEKNLPFLATVQSISPYIGLFGTVWGIMHALRALGATEHATISMGCPRYG